jgi:hypothetical protein
VKNLPFLFRSLKNPFSEFRAFRVSVTKKKSVCSFLQTPFEITMLSLLEAEFVNINELFFTVNLCLCLTVGKEQSPSNRCTLMDCQ